MTVFALIFFAIAFCVCVAQLYRAEMIIDDLRKKIDRLKIENE